jgi:alpha-N-arabinofuranosidase
VYASGTIDLAKSTFWKKYELTLTTAADVKLTTDAGLLFQLIARSLLF